jgi:hypothetical protein
LVVWSSAIVTRTCSPPRHANSVWQRLPGGPVAGNDDHGGEVWQYMGSFRANDRFRHEFRHRAHPSYDNARVYAHVLDDDSGPRLSRLVADGRELPTCDDCDEVAGPEGLTVDRWIDELGAGGRPVREERTG